MDPKASNQLDPKLQEAYDRVMGVATPPLNSSPVKPLVTSVQSEPLPVVPGPLAQTPSQSSTPPPASTSPINQPTSSIANLPSNPPAPQVQTPTQSGQTFVANENKTNAKPHAFVAKVKSGMKVSPVILAVGGVAFLLVYTIVWIKVFNLAVPFINQP